MIVEETQEKILQYLFRKGNIRNSYQLLVDNSFQIMLISLLINRNIRQPQLLLLRDSLFLLHLNTTAQVCIREDAFPWSDTIFTNTLLLKGV